MFGANITPEGVKTLAESAEKGQLKVWIDSVHRMEDVLAVRILTYLNGTYAPISRADFSC